MDVSCGKVVKENLHYKNVPTCGFFVFTNYSSRVLGVEEGGGVKKETIQFLHSINESVYEEKFI